MRGATLTNFRREQFGCDRAVMDSRYEMSVATHLNTGRLPPMKDIGTSCCNSRLPVRDWRLPISALTVDCADFERLAPNENLSFISCIHCTC